MKQGEYKKGIWVPASKNPTEIMIKPKQLPEKEQLKRYQRLCDIREEQQKIKLRIAQEMTQYRSLAQEGGRLLE
jgi:hypothetical protein